MEIDMTGAMKLRQLLNEHLKNSGIKISYNDIIMKCTAKAIETHTIINSTFTEEKIKVYKNVNFGLAVGLENGLVVPVIKNVNKKTISEITKENAENIEKAKKNKLQPSEMSGGTITLSNLGMYGVDCFTAIINQPESCILAIGGIIEKPVVINGVIVPRNMMNISASFDHRVIDGAVGAGFLKDVKAFLEKPKLLLL
jgi:pyruvate dehydrogenase E2 component (dihydrolipoamide acetyltransferase)